MTPLLTTSRLRLRSPGIGDATRLAELLDNFAVAGNLARVPHPYSLEDAHEWLGKWPANAQPSETNFIIDLNDQGAIGVIGFHLRDGLANIGYWLGEPFWDQGIMTEAMVGATDWFFDVTGTDSIGSGVFHFNMASLAIQQKLGFVETGRSMIHCLARAKDIEHIDTELTRDAFETFTARQKKTQKQ